MNWQPIETAPKDGTRVLITDGSRFTLGIWSEKWEENDGWYQWSSLPFTEDDQCDWDDEGAPSITPTHWTPISKPSN